MADIELVIKIPEEYYSCIKNISDHHCTADMLIIKNGTPLTKGHGRLVDADSMKTMKNIQSANFNAVELIRLWIDNQPTIIEADKEE